MGYRIIFITNPCTLSVKNEQLVVDSAERISIPLEDIECIATDNMRIGYNTYFLTKAAEYGITFYVTDRSHLPCGVFLPFAQHSRHLSVLKDQLEMTEPTKKRLWKEIIIRKIENQAAALRLSGVEDWREVDAIKSKVRSGDTSNMEGVAAAKYFKLMFGQVFTRSEENNINAALNYGYAVLRSTIAKNIAVYGFEPSLGLNHRSTLNNFNLADDLIEPFRPFVYLYVKLKLNDISEFTPAVRASIVDILNHDVLINGKRFACARAVEQEVMSLTSFLSNNTEALSLPELILPERHRYE